MKHHFDLNNPICWENLFINFQQSCPGRSFGKTLSEFIALSGIFAFALQFSS